MNIKYEDLHILLLSACSAVFYVFLVTDLLGIKTNEAINVVDIHDLPRYRTLSGDYLDISLLFLLILDVLPINSLVLFSSMQSYQVSVDKLSQSLAWHL